MSKGDANDTLNISNGIKAALIGGGVTFLLNAGAWVWGISEINTIQKTLKEDVTTLKQNQEALQEGQTELKVRVGFLEGRENAPQASDYDQSASADNGNGDFNDD